MELTRELSELLGGAATIHFPTTRDGFLHAVNPMANYMFVASDLPDTTLLRMERSRFVESVLCTPGGVGRYRQVSKVSDDELTQMLTPGGKDDFEIGQHVLVSKGDWSGLYGKVVDIFGEKLKVYIELRSRERVVTLNRDEVSPV